MTAQERQVISDVAAKVGTDPALLQMLIKFESNYNPIAKNPAPDSTARGLIQITDAAAKDIGFTSSLDAVTQFSDFTTQMYHVVLPYLEMRVRQYGPVKTEQQLYMSVFLPSYMNVPITKPFPAEIIRKNSRLKTPLEYINHVRKVAGVALLSMQNSAVVLILIGVGVLAWYGYKRGIL
jgi:hypothetical protein